MNLTAVLVLLAIGVSVSFPAIAWIFWALVIFVGLYQEPIPVQPKDPDEVKPYVSEDIILDFEDNFKPYITGVHSFRYYKDNYLKSPQWDTKRKQTLKRDHYTCQCCKADSVPLEVHHLSGYDLLPGEPIECLVSLCRDCHQAQHKFYGYPKTLEDYHHWDTVLYKGHL